LATHCSKTTITQLLRIGWRTVGNICTRVWADVEERVDLPAGLRRIGIDEISYKRHQCATRRWSVRTAVRDRRRPAVVAVG
jgi:hypothetical protein